MDSKKDQSELAFDLFITKFLSEFQQKESDETWDKFESLISKLSLLSESTPKQLLVNRIRDRLRLKIVQCLNTERTRLARSTMSLVQKLSTVLGNDFNELVDSLLPNVLKLTSRANKVYVNSAKECLLVCIRNSNLVGFIPNLVDGMHSPSKSTRIISIECLYEILDLNDCSSFITLIEVAIQDGVVDPASEVRDISKKCYELYIEKYPERVPKFKRSLTEIAKRYLKIGESPRKVERRKSVQKSVSDIKFLTKSVESLGSEYSIKEGVSGLAGASKEVAIDKPPLGNTLGNTSGDTLGNNSGNTNGNTERGGVSKPQRVQAEPEVKSGLNSAQRVPKQVEPAKSRLKPAQRVLSSENAFTEEEKPPLVKKNPSQTSKGSLQSLNSKSTTTSKTNSQVSLVSSTNSQPDPKTKSRRSLTTVESKEFLRKQARPALVKRSIPPKVELVRSPTLLDFERMINSSDWSERSSVFQDLKVMLETQSLNESNPQRIAALLNKGLSDQHFRVVHESLVTIYSIMQSSVTPHMLDLLLPRVLSMAYNPTQKPKPQIIQTCNQITDLVKQHYLDMLGNCIVHAFCNPSNSAKIRISVLSFVSTLSNEELKQVFLKPYVCKNFVVRIATYLTDLDSRTLDIIKTIFVGLGQVYSESVLQAAMGLSYRQRELISMYTGLDFVEQENPKPSDVKEPMVLSRSSSFVFDKVLSRTQSVNLDKLDEGGKTPEKVSGIPVMKKEGFLNVPGVKGGEITPVKKVEAVFVGNSMLGVPGVRANLGEQGGVDRKQSLGVATGRRPNSVEPGVLLRKQSAEAGIVSRPNSVEPAVIARKPSVEGSPSSRLHANQLRPLTLQDAAKTATLTAPIIIRSDSIEASVIMRPKSADPFKPSTPSVINRSQSTEPSSNTKKITLNAKELLKRLNALDPSLQVPERLMEAPKPTVFAKNAFVLDKVDAGKKDVEAVQVQTLDEVSAVEGNGEITLDVPKTDVVRPKSAGPFKDEHQLGLPGRPKSTEPVFKVVADYAMIADLKSAFKKEQPPVEVKQDDKTPFQNDTTDEAKPTEPVKESIKTEEVEERPRRESLQPSTPSKRLSAVEPPLQTGLNNSAANLLHLVSPPVDTLKGITSYSGPENVAKIKSGLLELVVALQLSGKALDYTAASDALTTVLELQSRLTPDSVIECGSLLAKTLKTFEDRVNLQSSIHSFVICLEKDLEPQICYEIITNIIPKLTDPDQIAIYDPLISQQLIKGLTSTKSSLRKAAFDLTFTMMNLRDEKFAEQFYMILRHGAGVPRENVIRGMIENRRKK